MFSKRRGQFTIDFMTALLLFLVFAMIYVGATLTINKNAENQIVSRFMEGDADRIVNNFFENEGVPSTWESITNFLFTKPSVLAFGKGGAIDYEKISAYYYNSVYLTTLTTPLVGGINSVRITFVNTKAYSVRSISLPQIAFPESITYPSYSTFAITGSIYFTDRGTTFYGFVATSIKLNGAEITPKDLFETIYLREGDMLEFLAPSGARVVLGGATYSLGGVRGIALKVVKGSADVIVYNSRTAVITGRDVQINIAENIETATIQLTKYTTSVVMNFGTMPTATHKILVTTGVLAAELSRSSVADWLLTRGFVGITGVVYGVAKQGFDGYVVVRGEGTATFLVLDNTLTKILVYTTVGGHRVAALYSPITSNTYSIKYIVTTVNNITIPIRGFLMDNKEGLFAVIPAYRTGWVVASAIANDEYLEPVFIPVTITMYIGGADR